MFSVGIRCKDAGRGKKRQRCRIRQQTIHSIPAADTGDLQHRETLMYRLALRPTIAAICITLSGCYAQGTSYSMNASDTEYFLTLKGCEEQATASNPDGSPKYVGYKCYGKFLFFTTEMRDFYHGKPTEK